jgi:hypothetical protein
MPPNDFVPNFDGSGVFVVFNQNNLGWTYIRTGSTSDAKALDGYGIIHAIPFFHSKGTRSDNFFADPDTQATANASVWRRTWINAEGIGQRNDGFGLGCHLEQILKRSGSGPVNRLAFGFYLHPVFYLQNTG